MHGPIITGFSATSANQREVFARCIAAFIAVPFRYLVGRPSVVVWFYNIIIEQVYNSYSWGLESGICLRKPPPPTTTTTATTNFMVEARWDWDEERELSVTVFLLMSSAAAAALGTDAIWQFSR